MQTFKKEERLSRKKIVDQLFSEGKSFIVFPFRIVWMNYDPEVDYPAQVLINVSKKRFKRAVDRNLIKRRTREAYRRNKESWYKFLDEYNFKCVFALLYISTEIDSFKAIEEKIILILHRLQSEYERDVK
jgi:ribonuclease P protein component